MPKLGNDIGLLEFSTFVIINVFFPALIAVLIRYRCNLYAG